MWRKFRFLKTVAFFFGLWLISIHTFAQSHGVGKSIPDGMDWPSQTSRPDTISKYRFTDTSISVKSFKGAKPVSIWCFKSKIGKVAWIPVSTKDVDGFVARNLHRDERSLARGDTRLNILDTLTCRLFGTLHYAIEFKIKRKHLLLIYQYNGIHQDVFYVTLKPRKNARQGLDYLEEIMKQ
ncbi:MAG: hypothetical protein JWO06_2751 [Bacteroidota bacterium]|nr:hypothetical protein [Bacteroidota bacterium]